MSSTPASSQQTVCPFCVDLDGTLIATDLLWESLVSMIRRYPKEVWRVPVWFILGGHCRLKRELADRSQINAATLPYNTEVLQFIREQKESGSTILLTTASYITLAQAVASHLGVFDGIIATDSKSNMKGARKLQAIREQYTDGFEYIGDSAADIPLWEAATGAYLVAPGRQLLARAEAVCTPKRIFQSEKFSPKILIKLLRPHQWVKNGLLALPLILAHQALDPGRIFSVLVAFISFSLCASSVYIVNDMLDVADDRAHPTKKKRPFASGKLQIKYGFLLLPPLLAASFIPAAIWLPQKFLTLLLFYLLLSTAYSIYLKRRLLVDVMVLAGLYTLRVLAGGHAAGVLVTPWLMAFSGFIFLSLAFAKRYVELQAAKDRGILGLSGRSYHVDDLSIIEAVGPASGYLAVLVLALYINSADVSEAYHRPRNLWLICPVMLYWLTRLWFFAKRRTLHSDPVMFALKDRMSWYVILISALIVWSSV